MLVPLGQDLVIQYTQHRFLCHHDSLQLYQRQTEVFWAVKDEFAHFLEWRLHTFNLPQLCKERNVHIFVREFKKTLPEADFQQLPTPQGMHTVCLTSPAECCKYFAHASTSQSGSGSCKCFLQHHKHCCVIKQGVEPLPLAASNLSAAGFKLLDVSKAHLLFQDIMLTNVGQQGKHVGKHVGKTVGKTVGLLPTAWCMVD